ncbi:MAG: hypothetical protein JRI71_16750, partial [Deltaproteobacteria bacterium]|nr:hypothetical protein [Deltaproteobacteria bacterium]
MQIQLDPARLDDFEKRLQGFSRTRVDAKSLWSMFAASFPGRPQGAEERRWFLACLHEMEHRGLIKFPSMKGKRWDKALGIAVPVSVDLIRKKPPAPVREWRQYPWHPKLQWIADTRQVSDKQF